MQSLNFDMLFEEKGTGENIDNVTLGLRILNQFINMTFTVIMLNLLDGI
jgi:hypothetical protein